MTFYNSEEFMLSCLDEECEGCMEIDFSESGISNEVNPECPGCGHNYNVILQDFEEEPEDVKHLKIYA